jgi:phosphinothricin acetyltransferase
MIRPATEKDVPEILSIYAPYIVNTTVTFEYEVPSEAVFLARFRSITARFPWLVWEENGSILGYAYASAPFERAAFGWCAEPSVYLRPQAHGRGIGSALYAVLEEVLRQQGFQLLLAIITQENIPSIRFHSHCGYTENTTMHNCGFKFGRWLGITWMEKRLVPVGIPNIPPVLWSEFRQDAQRFHDILANLSLS